jgi:hypothetical protein
MNWERVTFTEHMTEAAALEGACEVVLTFPPAAPAVYEIGVYRVLKGGAGEPYFARGRNRHDPEGFQPLGDGASAEEALQACLESAGVHHRRRARQSST